MKDAPAPRLCHVIKRDPEEGFGFNLLANKNEPGQYIGTVDAGSVAEASGLKQGDRLVEVNWVNVTQQTHKEVILLTIGNWKKNPRNVAEGNEIGDIQVVERIKAVANETTLLVIDASGLAYYNERNITITSTQFNVQVITTPPEGEEEEEEEEVELVIEEVDQVDQVEEVVVEKEVVEEQAVEEVEVIIEEEVEEEEEEEEEGEEEEEKMEDSVQQVNQFIVIEFNGNQA